MRAFNNDVLIIIMTISYLSGMLCGLDLLDVSRPDRDLALNIHRPCSVLHALSHALYFLSVV